MKHTNQDKQQNTNQSSTSNEPFFKTSNSITTRPTESTYKVPLQPHSDNENLLIYYSQEEKGTQSIYLVELKSYNQQNHNMNPHSPVYRLSFLDIQPLIEKYPSDFPMQMHEELKNFMPKIRQDYGFYQNIMFGSVLYWLLLRKRPWFKLTGNAFMRVAVILTGIGKMISVGFIGGQFLLNTTFKYHQQFEFVQKKYDADVRQGKINWYA